MEAILGCLARPCSFFKVHQKSLKEHAVRAFCEQGGHNTDAWLHALCLVSVAASVAPELSKYTRHSPTCYIRHYEVYSSDILGTCKESSAPQTDLKGQCHIYTLQSGMWFKGAIGYLTLSCPETIGVDQITNSSSVLRVVQAVAIILFLPVSVWQ